MRVTYLISNAFCKWNGRYNDKGITKPQPRRYEDRYPLLLTIASYIKHATATWMMLCKNSESSSCVQGPTFGAYNENFPSMLGMWNSRICSRSSTLKFSSKRLWRNAIILFPIAAKRPFKLLMNPAMCGLKYLMVEVLFLQ